MSEKKKPGPAAEVFRVPLPFEDAVKLALETPPPPREKKKRQKGERPDGEPAA